MNIRTKLILLLSLLFLAAFSNTAFIFNLESTGVERSKWVNHTNEVLSKSELLLLSLVDMETGQRGYLLTDDPSYLEPYHSGQINSLRLLNELKALTADNAEQQERLKIIDKQIQSKGSELKETISLFQDGNKEESLAIVKLNKGKQFMDNLRLELNKFVGMEQVLLAERKGDYIKNRAQITTLIGVEIIVFIVLAIVTITSLKKNLFEPMKLLLRGAEKLEQGKQLTIDDIVGKDEMSHLLSTFFQMSEKVHDREEALGLKAHYDELTNVKNRFTLYDDINEAIKNTDTSKCKVALIYFDLDNFKPINDTYGHDAGDAILKETADRIIREVRGTDTVYRVGGDEFVVLLSEVTDIDNVEEVADKLLQKTSEPISWGSQEFNITISIGAAIAPDDTTNSESLVKYADIAMYCAKRDTASAYYLFDKSMLKRGTDN